MKLFPAIDLKDNRCVRLTQGKEELLTIFNDNPIEQALFFQNQGCERLHLVDLDGAFGRKDINKETGGISWDIDYLPNFDELFENLAANKTE